MKSYGDRASSASAAREIGAGILCMGRGIVLTIFSFATANDDGKGEGRFFVFYALVLGGFVQMCRGLVSLVRNG
jgi:hypothetical protein